MRWRGGRGLRGFDAYGGTMLNRVTTAMLVVELLVIAVWFYFVRWTPMKAVGGVIVVLSMLLLIAARVELGRSFSVRAKATRLVTTGVYARLRNQIYLAGITLICGLALVFGRWWVLLVLVVIVPMQRARARREARVLEERFGEEYVRYRRRTWF